jgi:adenosylhomocysteine nucleosidase
VSATPPPNDPAPIGFVCAMPMELAPLRRRLSLTKARVGSLEVHRGGLAGRPVVAIVTGMGPVLAADHVVRLLDAIDLEQVVVVGITGTVEEDAAIGSLIRPELVIDGATGAAFRPGPLDPGPRRGTMVTCDHLITDPAVIAEMRADGVVSLDMETAAIAGVCETRGIPWSVFRCVSDRATDGSVDEELFRLSRPDGTADTRAVVAHVVRHPGRIPGLARMGRQAKLATERAADSAIRAVTAGPPPGG